MGTSNSAKELSEKLVAVGHGVTAANRNAVTAAAAAYKDSTLAAGRSDSGGDLRLSRWGRKGLRLNVGYDVDGNGPEASAVIKPRPMGPWKVLEYGAKPHLIVPGLTRRQAQALTLFSVMAGKGGDLGDFDIGALASTARGNRNNRGGRRRRPVKALITPKGFRAYARHPGTKPKRTWTRGVAKGTESAKRAYQREQVSTIVKAMR